MKTDNWTIWHFGGSLLLTFLFYGLTSGNWIAAAALAFACGIAWELADQLFGDVFTFLDPKGWSWGDISYDTLGVMVATGIIVIIGG